MADLTKAGFATYALCWCLLTVMFIVTKANQEIRIGALVADESYNRNIDVVIKKAVDYINDRADVLPTVNLTYTVERANSSQNSLAFVQSACKVASTDMAVVIGPSRSSELNHIHPIFAAMGIPQISPFATDPALSISSNPYPLLFKMLPPETIQSHVLVALIRYYGWNMFSIIASSSDYGYDGLKEIETTALEQNMTISAIGYFAPNPSNTSSDVRQILTEIRNKGTRVILLNCLAKEAKAILEQALTMGMTREGWAWLVTSGVTMTEGLYPPCNHVPYHQRGLLGVKSPEARGKLFEEYKQLWNSTDEHEEEDMLWVYSTLVFDSVLTAAYGLHAFLEDGNVFSPHPNSNQSVCLTDQEVSSFPDSGLADYIRNVSRNGVTNSLQFTPQNYVPVTDYQILNLQRDSWVEVGTYNVETRAIQVNNRDVVFPDNSKRVPIDSVLPMSNLTFKIVTILEDPYMQYQVVEGQNSGNLQGYCVDLIKQLRKSLGFQYEIYIVEDGLYGSLDPETDQWSGLMGDLVSGKADMILAPLAITYERETSADFTKSFQDTGTVILMAKGIDDQDYLAFMDPFSRELWIVVVVACIVCGIMNAVVSWLSPYGHRGRYSSRLRPSSTRYREDRNVFNLWNSLWFSFSQWMLQGTETSPHSFSGRMVYGVWYFSVMIISATYTANLAAFLTVQRLDTGVGSIDDLARQTAIQYGTVKDSSTDAYFRTKSSSTLSIMYDFMVSKGTLLNDSHSGIERVFDSYGRPGDQQFAFIFDAKRLKYASSSEPCHTRLVGRDFNQFGYGLAFPQGSRYVDIFSLEILKMSQSGFLDQLEGKWWAGSCKPRNIIETPSSDTQQASLTDMAGVFMVLLIGFVLVGLIVACEYYMAARQDVTRVYKKQEVTISFWESLRRRWKLIRQDFRTQRSVFFGAPEYSDASSQEEDTEHSPVPEYKAQNGGVVKAKPEGQINGGFHY